MLHGQKYAIHSPLLLLLCKIHRCRYRVEVSASIIYRIMGAGALINHIYVEVHFLHTQAAFPS